MKQTKMSTNVKCEEHRTTQMKCSCQKYISQKKRTDLCEKNIN